MTHLLDRHGPPDLGAKVEGGGTFNGVLIPPIHINKDPCGGVSAPVSLCPIGRVVMAEKG